MIISGTLEWAGGTANIIHGCEHDCRYCYAKAGDPRFGRGDPCMWKHEILRPERLRKIPRVRTGRLMFPSSHDITPRHLDVVIQFIERLLAAGNHLLIVSKPHLDCTAAISERFKDYSDMILFRFTIGSSDSDVLKFWEPGAPSFEERLVCLEYAFEQGFATSVSIEPMLDNDVDAVIHQVQPYVTDSIWLGKANMLKARLTLNGYKDPETLYRANQLLEWQSDPEIMALYARHRNNPQIRWKESIKKVVGIQLHTVAGRDE